jgi:hypothetical protein
MSLRPRYSLLTLLVLTAFVAGGVKLWYGPHHVVEQIEPHEEQEYTYTRNWRGQKIIHGPFVTRTHQRDGSLDTVTISFLRDGQNTLNFRKFRAYFPGSERIRIPLCGMPQLTLIPEEKSTLESAVAVEQQRIQNLGMLFVED